MMRIFSEDEDDFSPENFEILLFYGEKSLFSWYGDRLKVLKVESVDDGGGISLRAPSKIKNVQSFDERIFVTCSPCGVYKLSKNYQFALLSNTAIGIGARFYQVLKLENNYVYLGDKRAKTSRLLFKHYAVDSATIRIAGLVADTVDDHLFSVLLEGAIGENELCIFSNGHEIYKIIQDSVRIIYNSSFLVIDFVEIKKNGKLMGLLFITNKNKAILMCAHNGALIFEKIEINQKMKTAYATVDEVSENTIWIVHSDGINTYKSRKILGRDSIKSTKLNEQNISCLRYHNSEILGLTSTGKLIRVDPKMDQTFTNTRNNDFVKLGHDMLEETDSIVEAICEKMMELHSLDNELLDEENALKRINLVACQQNISTTPNLRLHNVGDEAFINCKLVSSTPEKCRFSFSVKSGGRKIFVTKEVVEGAIDVELPVPNSMLSEILDLTTDLITVAEEGYSWCLIKDCINDPVQKIEISDDKINFVNTRITALQNFEMKDRLDMVKLNAMKNNIRKEFKII